MKHLILVFLLILAVSAWADGNYAIDFDGTNDAVVVPFDSSLLLPDGVTIELWLNCDDTTKNHLVINKPTENGAHTFPYYDWGLILNDHGRLRFRFRTDLNWVSDADSLDENTWYHIVCTADGDSAKIYLNGARFDSTDNNSLPLDSTSANILIGRRADSDVNQFFDGTLDDIRIYNRAITAEEVTAHYNSGRTYCDYSTDSLKGAWDLNEGADDVAHDASVYENNGELKNSPTWVAGIGLCPPVALMQTTWYSEYVNILSTHNHGYANPDTLTPPKYTDYTPEGSCSTGSDTSYYQYHIQVGDDSSTTDTSMWGTGWQAFPDNDTIAKNTRTTHVEYDGNILQDGVQYHWRMRLKTIEGDSTEWSQWGTFMGVSEKWPTTGDAANCMFRQKIRAPGSHTAIPAYFTMDIPAPTGYGKVLSRISRFNFGVSGQACFVEYGDYAYAAVMGIDSDSTLMGIYVHVYDYNSDTWSAPTIVYEDTVHDVHNDGTLLIGADSCLHQWKNAHHDYAIHRKTTNAHVTDAGIDITTWDSPDTANALSSTSYLRAAKNSTGDILTFFRHSQPAANSADPDGFATFKGYYCYARYPYNGTVYDTCMDKMPIVWFSDDNRGAVDASMYSGGIVIDDTDTLHLVLGWHEDYIQADQMTRGISYAKAGLSSDSNYYVWIDINGDTVANLGFIDSGTVDVATDGSYLVDNSKSWDADQWNDGYCVMIYDGTLATYWRKINDTFSDSLVLSKQWYSSIDTDSKYKIFKPMAWGTCPDKIMVCHDSIAIENPGPFQNTPTLIISSNATGHKPFVTFFIDDKDYDAGEGKGPDGIVFATHDGSNWLLDNLACDTRFEIATEGDSGEYYRMDIDTGTTDGISLVFDKYNDSLGVFEYNDTSLGYARLLIDGKAYGSTHRADSSGLVDSISAYIWNYDAVACSVRLALYKQSDRAFICSTSWSASFSDSGARMITLPTIEQGQITKDTAYMIYASGAGDSIKIARYFHEVNADSVFRDTIFSGAWPATINVDTKIRYYCYLGDVKYRIFVSSDTIDNISSSVELRDSLDNYSSVNVLYVGIVLPDTLANPVWFDSGGTGMQAYYIAGSSDDMAQQAWTFTQGSNQIIDVDNIYVYALVRPDSMEEYSGAELYRWTLSSVFTSGYTDRWSGSFLSGNTAWGSGRIMVIPYTFDGRGRQLMFGMGREMIHQKDETFQRVRADGNDIIIMRINEAGDTAQYIEQHRTFKYAVQRDTVNGGSYIQVMHDLGVDWDANAPSPDDGYYERYWGNPAAGERPRNPDSVFYFDYESYESADDSTVLHGWIGYEDDSTYTWQVVGDSAFIYSQDRKGISSQKIFAGDKIVRAFDAVINRRWQLNTNDYHLRFGIYSPSSAYGNMYVKLYDGSSWVGIGYSSSSDSLRGGNDGGWDGYTYPAPVTRWHILDIYIQDSVIFVDNDDTVYTDNNIAQVDSVQIEITGDAYMMVDGFQWNRTVPVMPVFGLEASETRVLGGGRKKKQDQFLRGW